MRVQLRELARWGSRPPPPFRDETASVCRWRALQTVKRTADRRHIVAAHPASCKQSSNERAAGEAEQSNRVNERAAWKTVSESRARAHIHIAGICLRCTVAMLSLPPIAIRRIAELLGAQDASALARSCTRIRRALRAQHIQLARRTQAIRSAHPTRPASAPRLRPSSACIVAPAQSMLEAARAPKPAGRDYKPVRATSPTREQVYRQPYLLPPSDAEVAFSLQREAFRSAGEALRATDPSGVAGAFHARVNRIARAAAAHELISQTQVGEHELLTAAVPMQRVRFVQMRRLVPREDPIATPPLSSPRTAKLRKGFSRPSSAAAARAAAAASAGTPVRPASASSSSARAAPRPTVKPFFFVSPAPCSSSSAASSARIRSRPSPEGLGEGGIHGGGFATSPLLDPSVPAPRLLLNQPAVQQQQSEVREDEDASSSDEDDGQSPSLLASAAAGARPPRHSLHSVPLHGLQEEVHEEEAEGDAAEAEAESALETELSVSEQIATAAAAVVAVPAAELAPQAPQQSFQQLHASSHRSLHSALFKTLPSPPFSPEDSGPTHTAAVGEEMPLQMSMLTHPPAAESAPLPNLHADHAFNLQIAQINSAAPLPPQPASASHEQPLQPMAPPSHSRPPSSVGSQSARARRPAIRTPDAHSAASSARAVTHRSTSGATFGLSGLLAQVAGVELFDPALRARVAPVFTRRLVQLNHQRRQAALESAKAAQADRRALRIAQEVALVDRTWASYAQRKHHIEEDFAEVQRAVMRKQMERALQQQIALQEQEIARLHSAAPHESASPVEYQEEEKHVERIYEMPYAARSAASRPPPPLPHSHPTAHAASDAAVPSTESFFLSDPTRLALGAPVDLAAGSPVLPRPAGLAYFVPRELAVSALTKSGREQRQRARELAARRKQLEAQCAAHKDRFALLSQTHPTDLTSPRRSPDQPSDDSLSPGALPASSLPASALPTCTSPYLNRTAVRFDSRGRWDRPRDRPEQAPGGLLRASPPQLASAWFDVHWPTDRKG